MASTHTRGLRVRQRVIRSANSRSSLRVHTPFSSFRILAPAPPGHNLNVISYNWCAPVLFKGSGRGVEPQVLPGSAVLSAMVRCSFFVPGRPSGNPWERRVEKHQTQWLSMVCQEMPPPAGTSFLCTPLTPAYLWAHTPHPSLHRGTHFLIRAYTVAHLHTHQAYANKPSCEPVCIIFFLLSPSKIYTDHAYIST